MAEKSKPQRLVELICAYCGQTFFRLPSRIRRYCCIGCANADLNAHRPDVIIRFWAKVDRNGPIPESCPELGPCWIWLSAKGDKGYGIFTVGGRNVLAHRFAYERAYGPIKEGNLACHHCDNPPCIRPSHHFEGTNAENLADMMRKGRSACGDRNGSRRHPERLVRGEAHPNAKLTWDQVQAIRAAYGDKGQTGLTQGLLAKQYAVSRRLISSIVRNELWAPPADVAAEVERQLKEVMP